MAINKVKQPTLTPRQSREVIKKLGGTEGALSFLRGDTMVVPVQRKLPDGKFRSRGAPPSREMIEHLAGIISETAKIMDERMENYYNQIGMDPYLGTKKRRKK